jgi:hypothetical protein
MTNLPAFVTSPPFRGIPSPLDKPMPVPDAPVRPLRPDHYQFPDGRIIDYPKRPGPARAPDVPLPNLILADAANREHQADAGAKAFRVRMNASEDRSLDVLLHGVLGQRIADPAPRGTIARPIIRMPRISKR